ncbi:MAG: flavodoxin domain-containing protein [Dehalococcoidales bacterium]
MAGKVLVAYASKYGATKEIAEKIGEVLKEAGLNADIVPIKSVKNLGDHKDVVIGSAMYMGMWLREGANFLKKNEALLVERRVWVFSSGPSGKGDPVQLLKGVVLPLNVKQIIERIKPQDIAVFHGYLNEEKMNSIEKWVVKRVGGGFGDFRDWDMITKWAQKVAAAIKK